MTSRYAHVVLQNAGAIEVGKLSALAPGEFQQALVYALNSGSRVSAYFGAPGPGESVELVAILAADSLHLLQPLRCVVASDSFTSLCSSYPQLQLFEREIAEQMGLVPTGHPWLKPVRFTQSWRPGHDAWGRSEPPTVGLMDFFRVEGDQVHEVAVGPVHAGVIEPGHFRFQCHGEQVFHLEISLGYQHRGVEESLVGGPDRRSLHTIETLAGDTTIGHATAYAQVIEALAGVQPAPRAEAWRGIALELERLANHCGDLGALSGDVGFLPTAAYCGRLRGDYLNMTALLCGNRFGRGFVRPGGVGFDVTVEQALELDRRLAAAAKDTEVAVNLLWDSPSVMARFEETGPVSQETARDLGLVGPAARASGLPIDARRGHPAGVYQQHPLVPCMHTAGDVRARARVRWEEIQASIAWIHERLAALPDGDRLQPLGGLAPGKLAVALVEGWRGEICHVDMTDANGRFARYKVVDPSFHNWSGLAHAMRSQQISDFPLCNKSFNLSYCGHDL